MPEPDTRDARVIFTVIESEFRHALEAERVFLRWRAENPDAPFAEQLQFLSEWISASAPYAASYDRILTAFPEEMDRLRALLLPIQKEILG